VGLAWIEEQGKRILYSDFRGCASEAEMIALFEQAAAMVMAEPAPVLTMNNFEGVDVSAKFMSHMNHLGTRYRDKVRGKAVLGISSPFKKVLLNTYCVITGIQARACSSEAEARTYLTGLP
jgi:hypothetical protein